jgi:hypothetical protein
MADLSDKVTPSGVATTAQLNAKAPISSPTFTGTPAVPTASSGTDTTQVASTAFTKAAVDAATPDWELIYTTTTPADGTITLDTAKTFSAYRTLCFAGGNTGTGGLNRMIIPVSDFELGGVCVIFVMYNSGWRYVRVTHLTDTTFTLGSSGSGYDLGSVWGLK